MGTSERPSWKSAPTASFLFGSLALHGALLLLLGVAVRPDGIEFQAPEALEFGLADGQGGMGGDEQEPPDEPPPPPPPPPKPKPRPKLAVRAAPEPAVTENTGVEVEPADAPTPDAGPSSDAGSAESAVAAAPAPEHGLGDGFGMGAGGHGLGGLAPRGAQIGLYVDMGRVQDSSLSLETEALLTIVPGWRGVLAGSGVSPTRDLSQLFVATPNLRRANLVVAGRHRKGHPALRKAVSRLGGGEFNPREGIQVALWHDRTEVQRSIALFGLDSFVVTRSEDVDRVLAVTRAMAVQRARGDDRPRGAHGGELLAMYRKEAVALVVEDARSFVASDVQGVPAALRMSVTPIDEFYAELAAQAHYDSPEQASEALGFVNGRREQWIEHPRVDELGLRSAFESAELEREGKSLWLRAKLTLHQTRYLLYFVSHTLKPRG